MAAAWPAVEREALGGWTLRFSDGFTRRANSVLPAGDPGLPLAQAVERCEAAYAARGLPSCFQLRAADELERLGSVLAARGYGWERPALVLAGGLPPSVDDAGVTHDPSPSGEWLETWLAAGRGPGWAEPARAILERVSRPRSFALLRVEGVPVATALGTLSPGWLGLSSLVVQPDARRQGLAGRLLGSLAAWARAGGAERLWLEVEPGNEVALAWYRRLGLAEIGSYGYRTLPSIERTAS